MSENENKKLTKERMQIYEIGFAMIIKLLLVISGLVGFFIVLAYLIQEKDNTAKAIYGCLDLLLVGTIYVVYRHYFPNRNK